MEGRQSWDAFVHIVPDVKYQSVIWKAHWECHGMTEQHGYA